MCVIMVVKVGNFNILRHSNIMFTISVIGTLVVNETKTRRGVMLSFNESAVVLVCVNS